MTESSSSSLTVRDNRTGQEYDVPITDGTIKAADLGQIRVNEDEPGLATYDPGFVNTASTKSAVTYIDGDAGILERLERPPMDALEPVAAGVAVALLPCMAFGGLAAARGFMILGGGE